MILNQAAYANDENGRPAPIIPINTERIQKMIIEQIDRG